MLDCALTLKYMYSIDFYSLKYVPVVKFIGRRIDDFGKLFLVESTI